MSDRRDDFQTLLDDDQPKRTHRPSESLFDSIERELEQLEEETIEASGQLSGEQFVADLDPPEEASLFEDQDGARERFERASLEAAGIAEDEREAEPDTTTPTEETTAATQLPQPEASPQAALFDLRPAWMELWIGMPEFVHTDLTPWRSITIHLAGPDELKLFEQAIEKEIGPKTKSLWFPDIDIWTFSDTRYADES